MISSSLLRVPDRTEAEARIEAALKVARLGEARMTTLEAKSKPLHAIQWARVSFRKVIRLLEDGRLPATSSIFQQRDPKGECNG